LWTKWQWQDIDGDPSSLFVDYTHRIDGLSTLGAGFLQHNTGLFLNTGANLNYTRAFQLVDGISLLAGINVFVFNQKVADERYLGTEPTNPPLLEGHEGFRAEFSPGLQLLIDRFRLGLALENAFGLIFSGEGGGRHLQHMTISLSNDFPLPWFGGGQDNFLRPMAYVKAIPGVDAQFGLNALLSSPKFWAQGGYNSFYGASVGLGVTLARSISLGGIMEFATDRDLEGKRPSIELLAAYRFGKTLAGPVELPSETEDAGAQALADKAMETASQKAAARARIQKEKDSLAAAIQKTAQLSRERQSRDSLAQRALQRSRDSLAQAAQEHRKDSLARAVQERRKDSLAARVPEKIELRPQEKFEEIQGEEGLEPGFYLIANVFGTKRYFEDFMRTLQGKGLQPKSFFRASNKFNYVYLERYDTMEGARRARDSKFFGKYGDKTWIFRVRGL